MNDAKEKCENLLKNMSPSDRVEALRAWMSIKSANSEQEMEEVFDQIRSSAVAEFVSAMLLASLDHVSTEKAKHNLQENAAAVRKNALQILLVLIPAKPTTDHCELTKQAIAMARQLQDAF